MRKFLEAILLGGHGRRPGQLAIFLIPAVVLLAPLLWPAIHAAAAARSGDLANGAQACGLTNYLLAAAAGALPGMAQGFLSFAMVLALGMPLVGIVALMWRSGGGPASRS